MGTVSGRVGEGLTKLVDGFVQLGIIATKKDVFVGGIDVLDIGLLEDCFGLPSKRYEGDDLEVGCQRSSLLLGMLDEADGSERKEGFGRIRVEQRLHSVKGNIGGGSWVLSR